MKLSVHTPSAAPSIPSDERVLHQSLLLEISEALLQAPPDRVSVASIVYERVRGPLKVDVCFNYEIFEGELRLVAGFGIPEHMMERSRQLKLGEAFCGTVALTRKPLRADESCVLRDPKGAFVHAMKVRSVMCHPLFSRQGDLIGTYTLASTLRDSFTEAETEFLQTLCHFISMSWERDEVELTRQRLESQLIQSQKMEALGNIAGGVAHDFNNLILAIEGHAESAGQSLEQGHPAREDLEGIIRASGRARSLVKGILGFARPSAPVQERVSLPGIAEEVVHLLKPGLPPGILLSCVVATEVPEIQGDASQLHQVLVNLITNAAQAIPEGKGAIELRLRSCFVDSSFVRHHVDLRPGDHLVISVHDSGQGMDRATLTRIFDPFFTTKSAGKGTGLGLAVVQTIVRAHKGAILVDSKPGQGTSFHLYFPALKLQPARRVVSAAPVELLSRAEVTSPGLSMLSGLRMLFLDDDSTIVRLCEMRFSKLGCSFMGMTQAEDAVEVLRADPKSFDLLVADYNMPGLSGLEVARRIQALDPDLPVFLTSGFISEELRAKASEYGVREVLYKPDIFEELSRVLPSVFRLKMAV